MTIFDYAVLLIVGLSILLSVMRGLVREVLALLAWVVAIWLATAYATDIARLLPGSIPNDSVRMLAAFVILFLGALLLMSLVTMTLGELVKSLGLGVMDRSLGAVFGLARGVLIVTVLVLLAGLTTLPKQPLWRSAMFSAPLEAFAQSVTPWLPEDLRKRISYE
jgi:membrane protein required for colicin V production